MRCLVLPLSLVAVRAFAPLRAGLHGVHGACNGLKPCGRDRRREERSLRRDRPEILDDKQNFNCARLSWVWSLCGKERFSLTLRAFQAPFRAPMRSSKI
eukprot:scaffold1876_cov257-Pinguiococcus_pyrenoidosus.AAC.4